MLIALGSKTIASYPEGGPLALGFIQYALGLRALGHRVVWVEVIKAELVRSKPELAAGFFALMGKYGLADDCALIAVEDLDNQVLEGAEVYGMSAAKRQSSCVRPTCYGISRRRFASHYSDSSSNGR